VIAATNRRAESLLSKGLMRADFYYRLCSDVIVVPPLRQRITEDPGELDDIVGALIAKITGQPSPELAKMVLEIIDHRLGRDYPWPGNVRELAQCVRRILLNRSYTQPTIGTGTDLHPEFVQAMAEGRLKVTDLQAAYCHYLHMLFGTYGEVARRTGLDRRTVKKYVASWNRRIEEMPTIVD
jgi:transcriptional regulator with PAS, ATPase and Fis domain